MGAGNNRGLLARAYGWKSIQTLPDGALGWTRAKQSALIWSSGYRSSGWRMA